MMKIGKKRMKKVILILTFFLLACFTLLAVDPVLPLEILEKQQEIKNFKVDVELVISTHAGQDSEFFFTYYYEEPDKIYLETDDFVLLPKEALKTMQPSFFQADKYSFNYLGKKEGLDILELIPLDKGEKYRLYLAIDSGNSIIRSGELFFQMANYREEFNAIIYFADIDGYALPVYIEGELAVPTKFAIGGEIKEYREGSFHLKLKDYAINIEFPEKIKKSLSSN